MRGVALQPLQLLLSIRLVLGALLVRLRLGLLLLSARLPLGLGGLAALVGCGHGERRVVGWFWLDGVVELQGVLEEVRDWPKKEIRVKSKMSSRIRSRTESCEDEAIRWDRGSSRTCGCAV